MASLQRARARTYTESGVPLNVGWQRMTSVGERFTIRIGLHTVYMTRAEAVRLRDSLSAALVNPEYEED